MYEQWAVIDEFPLYQVSETGKVRSLRSGKELKGSKHKQGYTLVFLTNTQGEFGRLVHRLVAQAFIPNPKKLPNVCHNDGDPSNNHKMNLRWDNQHGNILDCHKHGTARTVLNKELVLKIRKMHEIDSKWGCITRISKALDLNRDTVRDVIQGRSWGWVD